MTHNTFYFTDQWASSSEGHKVQHVIWTSSTMHVSVDTQILSPTQTATFKDIKHITCCHLPAQPEAELHAQRWGGEVCWTHLICYYEAAVHGIKVLNNLIEQFFVCLFAFLCFTLCFECYVHELHAKSSFVKRVGITSIFSQYPLISLVSCSLALW